MTRNLTAAVNDNQVSCFRALATHAPNGDTRQFGSTTAVSVGVPTPIYNRIFAFDPLSDEELMTAVAWMEDRQLPFAVTVTESALDTVESLAPDVGLELSAEAPQPEPGMALPSLAEIPPNETAANIVKITDDAGLDEFIAVASRVFELDRDICRQVNSDSLLEDAEMGMFLGRVDGQAAACGRLVQTGDLAGVYAIGVIEEYRRRGIGAAMTWVVLRAGREAGCHVGVLSSSEMAYPLYQQMGFETVVNYYHFVPTD